MKITELIGWLEEVEEEYGDVPVHATCDGWLPPEIEVQYDPDRQLTVLYGVRRVSGRVEGTNMVTINAGQE